MKAKRTNTAPRWWWRTPPLMQIDLSDPTAEWAPLWTFDPKTCKTRGSGNWRRLLWSDGTEEGAYRYECVARFEREEGRQLPAFWTLSQFQFECVIETAQGTSKVTGIYEIHLDPKNPVVAPFIPAPRFNLTFPNSALAKAFLKWADQAREEAGIKALPLPSAGHPVAWNRLEYWDRQTDGKPQDDSERSAISAARREGKKWAPEIRKALAAAAKGRQRIVEVVETDSMVRRTTTIRSNRCALHSASGEFLGRWTDTLGDG